MNEYCVIIADGARARFFTLEAAEIPEMESGPNLQEQNDLINPEAETQGQELWSNTKSGRNRAVAGGGGHGYDDHRGQHEAEFVNRFARLIAEQAAGFVQQNKPRHLVIAADKSMLGFIRDALNHSPGLNGLEIHELAKNISKLSALDIHQHLSDARLIPKRRKPGET